MPQVANLSGGDLPRASYADTQELCLRSSGPQLHGRNSHHEPDTVVIPLTHDISVEGARPGQVAGTPGALNTVLIPCEALHRAPCVHAPALNNTPCVLADSKRKRSSGEGGGRRRRRERSDTESLRRSFRRRRAAGRPDVGGTGIGTRPVVSFTARRRSTLRQ